MRRTVCTLWLLVMGATASFAQSHSNASRPIANPAPTAGRLAVTTKSEGGESRDVERVLAENSGLAEFCIVVTTGSANTPVRVATSTPTVGATTPTPTPNGGTAAPMRWCSMRSWPSNIAELYWNSDAAVSTSTGTPMMPGEWVFDLSAADDGTCGAYYLVSATGSQKVSVCYGR